MKTHFTALAFAAPMLAAALGFMDEPPEEEPRLSRQEIELELSFARLQDDLRDRKFGSEDARVAMARWHDAHADKIGEIAKQRAARIIPVPPDPGAPPIRDGQAAADYMDEVAAFKARLVAFVGYSANKADDSEWGRQEIARRMEHPSVRAMEDEFDKARAEFAAIPPGDDTLPLSSEELAALPEWERAEEEIYAAIYAVTREPFSPRDEYRDRVAPLHGWIHEKRKGFAEEVRREAAIHRAERRAWLESELDRLLLEPGN